MQVDPVEMAFFLAGADVDHADDLGVDADRRQHQAAARVVGAARQRGELGIHDVFDQQRAARGQYVAGDAFAAADAAAPGGRRQRAEVGTHRHAQILAFAAGNEHYRAGFGAQQFGGHGHVLDQAVVQIVAG